METTKSTEPSACIQYGNVRSDDAYKGGGGINDGDVFHTMETFVASRPDQWNYDGIWFNIYVGIRRANEGIRVLSRFSETEYPLVKTRVAELRFLRGYWYLMLENLFKNIPYIDDTVPAEEYKFVKNNSLTRDQILDKIASDFQAAADVLPATQSQIGRANKYAAFAFLAKTRLFQAYTQNATHAVTGIDQTRYKRSSQLQTRCWLPHINYRQISQIILPPELSKMAQRLLCPFSSPAMMAQEEAG